MITKKALSRIIYDQDPIGTCCYVNDGMENEYDQEAGDIISMLEQGVPFRNAYFSSMSYFFDSDSPYRKEYFFEVIQMDYYNHISKHDPERAIYAARTVRHDEATRIRQSAKNYRFWKKANRLIR